MLERGVNTTQPVCPRYRSPLTRQPVLHKRSHCSEKPTQLGNSLHCSEDPAELRQIHKIIWKNRMPVQTGPFTHFGPQRDVIFLGKNQLVVIISIQVDFINTYYFWTLEKPKIRNNFKKARSHLSRRSPTESTALIKKHPSHPIRHFKSETSQWWSWDGEK